MHRLCAEIEVHACQGAARQALGARSRPRRDAGAVRPRFRGACASDARPRNIHSEPNQPPLFLVNPYPVSSDFAAESRRPPPTWRPLPLLPQVQDVPATVVVEIELAVGAPLHHARIDKLVQVGPLKAEMPRHRRPRLQFHARDPRRPRVDLPRSSPKSSLERSFATQHTANFWATTDFTTQNMQRLWRPWSPASSSGFVGP